MGGHDNISRIVGVSSCIGLRDLCGAPTRSIGLHFFCQDGFVCDLPNNRCLPGPQALQKLSAAQEAARQQNLKYNRYLASAAQQSDSQLLGYDMGSTYYIFTLLAAPIERQPRHRHRRLLGCDRARPTFSGRLQQPGPRLSASKRSRARHGRFQ